MTAPGRFEQRGFTPLPENRLAVAAVKRLAPGIKRRSVKLICLVGLPGAGKSHLARELLRSWEEHHSEGKRILVTASQFAAQLAEASASGAIAQFQRRYRNDTTLLICEDLQTIAVRSESQQQILSAVDDILAQGGLVLVTSTQMPGEIPGLSRKLVNRLHGGICVNLELPGPASRKQLLEQFLDEAGVRLPPEDVQSLAEQHPVSPRELRGLVSQLKTEQNAARKGPSTASRNLVRQLADRKPGTSFRLADIARVTAARFGLKVADLKSPRRSQSLSSARQTAMYLARQMGGYHYTEIGTFFNRSNHSTVIHACRKVAALREEDVILDHEILAITEELKRRSGTP